LHFASIKLCFSFEISFFQMKAKRTLNALLNDSILAKYSFF